MTIETSRVLSVNKRKIAKYEQRIDEIKDSDKYLAKKESSYLQKQVKQFHEHQANAAKIRPRVKYLEEGEKVLP